MKIQLKDVEYVANLARLELSGQEKEMLCVQLEKILEYMDKLNRVDTGGVSPMSHVVPVSNVFRPDKVEAFENIEGILKNAPESESRLFKVKKVIE